MPRFVLRFLLLGTLLGSALPAAQVAYFQGSFAHFAYGAGYQTVFTFINTSTAEPASATLSFYDNNGTALKVDVDGAGMAGPYNFTIPAGNSVTVALLGDANAPASTEGWAALAVAGGAPTVGGQALLRRHLEGQPDFEAVVPLSTALLCQALQAGANPLILLPFDNTSDKYVTALALANTSAISQSFVLDYYDEAYVKIASKTLTYPPFSHYAFLTGAPGSASAPDAGGPKDGSDKLVAGKKGVLRVTSTSSSYALLGLRFNASGAFTTILPVSGQ